MADTEKHRVDDEITRTWRRGGKAAMTETLRTDPDTDADPVPDTQDKDSTDPDTQDKDSVDPDGGDADSTDKPFRS